MRRPEGLVVVLLVGLVLNAVRVGGTSLLMGNTVKSADKTIAQETAILARDPSNYEALVKRADAYWVHTRTSEAIADYSAAIRLQPEISLAYEKRALMWDAAGNYDRAQQDRQMVAKLRDLRNQNR